MKVTKTLVRYAWLYNSKDNYGLINSFSLVGGDWGGLGFFLIIPAAIAVVAIIVGLELYQYQHILIAFAFSLAIVCFYFGILMCLENAIESVQKNREKAKQAIEKASFEWEWEKND